MSQKAESKYSIGPAFAATEKVLYTSFNPECSRFCVGTTCGFHVYSCEPILKELFSNSKEKQTTLINYIKFKYHRFWKRYWHCRILFHDQHHRACGWRPNAQLVARKPHHLGRLPKQYRRSDQVQNSDQSGKNMQERQHRPHRCFRRRLHPLLQHLRPHVHRQSPDVPKPPRNLLVGDEGLLRDRVPRGFPGQNWLCD